MKIYVACGNGIGSSLILKINIEKVLKELGRKDIKVGHSDLGPRAGLKPDLIIASKDIVDSCPPDTWVIGLTNIMDRAG